MKHKHYDMIVAKAANMDLVVFVRDGNDWRELTQVTPFYEDNSYFLCLPQHKEACLHWLNGGDVQIIRHPKTDFLDWDRPSREWRGEVSFMFDSNKFRVKPKKEKRWIGVDPSHLQQSTKLFKSEDDLWSYFGGCAGNASGYQFIEIEVEV